MTPWSHRSPAFGATAGRAWLASARRGRRRWPKSNRTSVRSWRAAVYHLPPMPDFKFVAPFQPTGDQPQAIDRLVDGLERGVRHQTLLGATGTGKTATLAWTIERYQKPTLVLAHNKTLAAQLYARVPRVLPGQRRRVLRQLLRLLPARGVPAPERHVHREGLVTERRDRPAPPRRDPRPLRAPRRDHRRVSVSCIYGLGAPVDYGATVVRLRKGGSYRRDAVLRQLVDLQYQRNDQALTAGPLPGPRRHARVPAGVGGRPRPGRVLRRRGRADHRGRPADRRAPRRAQRGQRLPGEPLRHAGRTR